MHALRWCVLALTALAGCADNNSSSMDLSVRDLGGGADQSMDLSLPVCMPAGAVPDPYVVKLQLQANAGVSLDNVRVEMRKHSDDSLITSGVTDGTGAVTLSTASGGKPIDAYLIALPGGADASTLPPAILDIQGGLYLPSLNLFFFSQSFLDAFAATAGETLDPAKGVLDIFVDQCNVVSAGLQGAVVSLTPSTPVVYVNSMGKFDNQLNATSTHGEVGALNQPAGSVEITTHYMGGVSTYTTKVFADTYHHIVLFP